MTPDRDIAAPITRRSPDTVMRLARMGSFHPMRLSFMRILMRRMKAEGWRFARPVWQIDDRGVGRAVYTATGPKRTYSLVAFAHDLPAHLRSDRVIAEAWDATFALYDGVPSGADIDRLEQNVPLQEAGRVTERELTLSRANRSVRLFRHVVDALAAGDQPDQDEIDAVGYLMRTTAVYGSAKFGLSDRDAIADRPELAAPFQAEMLSVFLIRAFTVDIAEHMARVQGGDRAVRLERDLRRRLGVGNSTGLGMAPFLLTHPVLINNWIGAREEALMRVRQVPEAEAQIQTRFRDLVRRASRNADEWISAHPIQIERLADLRRDLAKLSERLETAPPSGAYPWETLWRWAEGALGLEGQEQLVSLLIEPYGDLVDELAGTMSADEDEDFAIDGRQSIAALRAMIERDYRWALDIDWSRHDPNGRLWYVSAEKLEPRLAERQEEPLEPYEQPLAPGRDVAALAKALDSEPPDAPVAAFLMQAPAHRHAVRRVQRAARHPFAEVRDNTIDAAMMPIDLLRAKLAFFGANRFDPRSDRWVRIAMYLGAPYPDELHEADADDWMLPA